MVDAYVVAVCSSCGGHSKVGMVDAYVGAV